VAVQANVAISTGIVGVLAYLLLAQPSSAQKSPLQHPRQVLSKNLQKKRTLINFYQPEMKQQMYEPVGLSHRTLRIVLESELARCPQFRVDDTKPETLGDLERIGDELAAASVGWG
jgi:hypothetical protein